MSWLTDECGHVFTTHGGATVFMNQPYKKPGDKR